MCLKLIKSVIIILFLSLDGDTDKRSTADTPLLSTLNLRVRVDPNTSSVVWSGAVDAH